MGIDALSAPALGFYNVTSSNSTALSPPARALFVGGTGDVALTGWDSSTAVFYNVPAGSVLPVRARFVSETGTSATSIVAIY